MANSPTQDTVPSTFVLGPSTVARGPGGAEAAAKLQAASKASLSQVTLASVLGQRGLSSIVLPDEKKSGADDATTEIAVTAVASSAVFAEMMKVITTLQTRLQETEASMADAHSKSDAIDKKCRSWRRQVERAESDAADAQKRRDNTLAMVSKAKMEAAPLIEHHMEAEVLRHQTETLDEEVKQLQRQVDVCEEELVKGLPRLEGTESLEAELSQALSEMEAAHTDEVAMLRSLHIEEMSDLRVQHATGAADLEAARLAESSHAKILIYEDFARLKSAIDEAEWQSDVYVREQEDMIREVCMKQRDNTRLAKRHSQVRQEALELSMKWEAAGPALCDNTEAELNIVRQRCALLQRTATEWREALHRKSADCSRWRRRAATRGIDVGPAEAEEVFADFLDSVAEPTSPLSVASAIGTRLMASQAPGLDWSSISASAPESPRGGVQPRELVSSLPTPTRTLHRASSQSGQSTPVRTNQDKSTHRHDSKRQVKRSSSVPGPRVPLLPNGPPDPLVNQNASLSMFPWDFIESLMDESYADNGFSGLHIPEPSAARVDDVSVNLVQKSLSDGESAHEFLACALRASQIWANAEAAGKGVASHSPDSAAGETPQASTPGTDPRSKLAVEVLDAENELEMLAFLLDESASLKAEELLELQARHQPAPIARRLRQHLEALALRRHGH